MNKNEVIDDDGNTLREPEAGSDTANLMYLLMWGRKHGFKIGPTVQIGDVILNVQDLRQQRTAVAETIAEKREATIWEENGHIER